VDDKPTGPPPARDEAGRKPLCDGHNRQGKTCGHVAGFGTDHVGFGKCKFHGGATPSKSGLYSKIHSRRPRIVELAKEFEKLEDPFNILPELAMVRALARDWIEHFEEYRDALLAWYASWQAAGSDNGPVWRSLRSAMAAFTAALGPGDTGAMREHLAKLQTTIDRGPFPDGPVRPREVPDIADGHRILVEVTKIVDRHQRLAADTAVSRADLVRIMSEMGNAVALYVTAPDLTPEERLKRIRDAWANIHL
jgi:hypothetical protein